MAQDVRRRRKKRRRRKNSSGPVLILALVLLAVAGGIVFAVTRTNTPAAVKTPDPTAAPVSESAPASPADHSTPAPTEAPVWSRDIVFSEVCPKNEGSIRDADGEFSDWVELENTGSETVSLKGWYLSDKEDQLYLWPFPDVSLAPGERLLVFASGKDRAGDELHASFSLSDGETVTLSTPAQEPVSAVSAAEAGAAHRENRMQKSARTDTYFFMVNPPFFKFISLYHTIEMPVNHI